MISAELVEQRLQSEALKDRMILDSILILATCDKIQDQIEEKLLEIDDAKIYNNGQLSSLKNQVFELLAKLHREEHRMDEYMVKYRKLVNEEKTLLSRPRTKKQIYLRGVPPNTRGLKKSPCLSKQNETPAQNAVHR